MSTESPRRHSDHPSALAVGTRLGEFEVLSLLGVGGFGIVYLAFDHALEREVAVKEYMPASLAGRTETMHVSLRSQSDAETFALGLRSFVNEARLLARFDHPSLLKVLRFWEANGTAYMAMPVMRGNTLKEIRLDMTGAPDEAWTRTLLEPLLGAIERLHSEGVYHRDIAPDNIQIEPGGRPVLLDFGAARRVISDKSQTLTAILKPAYAPIEQYAEVGSVKQGPWTDIYALGATLHFLLLARPPAPATARAVHDDASALTQQALPGYSENFLQIVDWMLAPRPADRPQNVAMLRDALQGRIQPPHRRSAETPSHWERTVAMAPAQPTVQPTVQDTHPGDDQATLVMPRAGVATGARTLPPAPGSAGAAGARPGAASQGGRTGTAAGAAAGATAKTAAYASPATGFDPDFDRSPAPPPYPHVTGATTGARRAPGAAPSAASGPAAASAPARSRLIPVMAGVVVIAVAAVAAVFWPRQPTAPVVAAPAVLAPPSTVAAAPPPLASSVPESAVATVVLPRTPDAAALRSAGAPAQSSGATTAATTASTTAATSAMAATPAAGNRAPMPSGGTRAAGERSTAGRGNAATQAPGIAAPGAGVATQAPAATPAPEPAAPAPLVAAAPEPAKPAAAAGPEATCGVKNPLSYFVCMERTCLKSEFSNHGDCQKWHKDARAARRD